MSTTWLESVQTPPANTKSNETISSEANYTIIRVPNSSPNLTSLVTRFRATKLSALQTDPKSFVQRYDLESQQPLSVWESRLTRKITILACIANADPSLTPEENLLQNDWIAYAAVRGPITYSDYYACQEMGQVPPQDPEAETRWHLYDLYTFPAHRGQGIAKRLGEALFAVIAEDSLAIAEGVKRARMRLIVHPKSTWLVDGYRKLGFEKSGMVTLKEGFVANGMEESVPEDTGSTEELRALWETRYGMAMEKVVEFAN